MLRENFRDISYEVRPHTLWGVREGRLSPGRSGSSVWIWVSPDPADPIAIAEDNHVAIFASYQEAKEAAEAMIDTWLSQQP